MGFWVGDLEFRILEFKVLGNAVWILDFYLGICDLDLEFEFRVRDFGSGILGWTFEFGELSSEIWI